MVNQSNTKAAVTGYLVDDISNIQQYSSNQAIKYTHQEFDFFQVITDNEFDDWNLVNEQYDGVVMIPPTNPSDRSKIYVSIQKEYEFVEENPFSDRIFSVVDSLAGGIGAYSTCEVENSISGLWNKVTSTWERSKTEISKKQVTYLADVHPTNKQDFEFLKSIPQKYLSDGDKKALAEYQSEENQTLSISRKKSHKRKRIGVSNCVKKVRKSAKKQLLHKISRFGDRARNWGRSP